MFRALFAAPILALAACMSTPEIVATEGALGRQVDRVVERHNAYVVADEDMPELEAINAMADAQRAAELADMPEVNLVVLGEALDPVMIRHDSYVQSDPELDELERGVYLGSTAALRNLLDQVPD